MERSSAFYDLGTEILYIIYKIFRSQWSLAWWECRFEYRRGHGSLSLVSVVCYQVEVSCFGLIPRLEEPYRVWWPECNREARKGRP